MTTKHDMEEVREERFKGLVYHELALDRRECKLAIHVPEL
jgi:hypothetical protein